MRCVALCLLASVVVYVNSRGESEEEMNCASCTQVLMARMITLEHDVAEMKKTVADLERKNEELSQDLKSQTIEIQYYQNEIIQLGRQSELLNNTVINLHSELTQVREQRSELNNTVQRLENELIQVQEKTSELNITVKSLELELVQVREEKSDINNSLNHLDLEFTRALTNLVEENEKLNSSLKNLHFELETLEGNQQELNATVRVLIAKDGIATIAFKARLGNNVNITNENILIFENVLRNTYDGYNQSTGVFVAPIDGSYLFSATVLSQMGKYVHLKFIKNSTIELGRFFTGEGGDTAHSGSETIVVDLQKGDHVCVTEATGMLNRTGYVLGGGWSSFMGVLLAPY